VGLNSLKSLNLTNVYPNNKKNNNNKKKNNNKVKSKPLELRSRVKTLCFTILESSNIVEADHIVVTSFIITAARIGCNDFNFGLFHLE
jgi:hypothetical protein